MKSINLTGIFLFIILSVFTCAASAAMQATGSTILQGTPVTIAGTVSSVGIQGAGMSVDTGDEIITVYGIGPVRFWNSIGITRPQVGEDVVVNGYEVTFSDGTSRVIATEISVGGNTVLLRDPATGFPAWRAAGGRGMRGTAGGQGMGLRDGSCLAR